MTDQRPSRHTPSVPPGLCGGCRHSRRIPTRGGTAYQLCLRASEDASYPRYPALPRLSCRGFERADGTA